VFPARAAETAARRAPRPPAAQTPRPPAARALWRLAALGLATLAALTLTLAPAAPATAAPAQPLAIAQFTLQTTRTGETAPFVNEPYGFDQAGGHPIALTTTTSFATETTPGGPAPTRDPKEVAIDLPPGLIANPRAVAACAPSQGRACPVDSQVGVFAVRGPRENAIGPIVNVVPSGEEPAELELETRAASLPLSGRLIRAPGGYALSVLASGLPTLGIASIEITLWGVPAEARHDAQRGRFCLGSESKPEQSCEGGGQPSGAEARPFITLPTVCSGAGPTATTWADSWQEPGHYAQAQASLAPLRGCELLPFAPQLALRPDTLLAEAPVAAELSLAAGRAGAAIASPPLRAVSVTLPQGMTLDPSIGNGLQACAATGPEGIDLPNGVAADGQALAPDEVGEGEEGVPGGEPRRLAPGNCPAASTIGLVEARSPLLDEAIHGRVYLAAPACGGAGQAACGEQDAADGSLYRVYVELGGRGQTRSRGLILKLPGEVLANPATGQLTVRLSEIPQLPLEELSIALFGGSRSLLVNPSTCALASTSSDLMPWGAPSIADASPRSFYEVTGCAPSPPFAPTLLAGSRLADAGISTPFSFQLSRSVGEQQLAQVQLRGPLGLSAALAGVSPCPPAAADAGACPASSQIGSSLVALGDGYEPLDVPGQVYLTGPYGGAPFGLAIVADADVGPLRLGAIAIRARLDVDPRTAALTITSDRLPRILLGAPLHLRSLTLDIDRPGLLLNPTDCAAQRVSATLLGDGGAIATPASPFAVGGCRALGFAPRLSASSTARSSLLGGASLDLQLAEPASPPGGDANLARLRIALPRALATRLTALQSSCPASTFASNPARCPAASVIGIARVRTQLVSSVLSGPVYLLARGRDALPSPTVVLQGQGIALQLSGSTQLGRGGSSAVSFGSLPDIPLRSFELYLPPGRHSLLVAAANLCAAASGEPTPSLPLASELAAQNGIVLHRRAAIAVLGCPGKRHRPRHR
jgi:hypothetical protein